jgi:hypothetical protein
MWKTDKGWEMGWEGMPGRKVFLRGDTFEEMLTGKSLAWWESQDEKLYARALAADLPPPTKEELKSLIGDEPTEPVAESVPEEIVAHKGSQQNEG